MRGRESAPLPHPRSTGSCRHTSHGSRSHSHLLRTPCVHATLSSQRLETGTSRKIPCRLPPEVEAELAGSAQAPSAGRGLPRASLFFRLDTFVASRVVRLPPALPPSHSLFHSTRIDHGGPIARAGPAGLRATLRLFVWRVWWDGVEIREQVVEGADEWHFRGIA